MAPSDMNLTIPPYRGPQDRSTSPGSSARQEQPASSRVAETSGRTTAVDSVPAQDYSSAVHISSRLSPGAAPFSPASDSWDSYQLMEHQPMVYVSQQQTSTATGERTWASSAQSYNTSNQMNINSWYAQQREHDSFEYPYPGYEPPGGMPRNTPDTARIPREDLQYAGSRQSAITIEPSIAPHFNIYGGETASEREARRMAYANLQPLPPPVRTRRNAGPLTNASQTATAMFPLTQPKQSDPNEQNLQPTSSDTAKQCPICLNKFKSGTITKCEHFFCTPCIITWLSQAHSCPMCRFRLRGVRAYDRGLALGSGGFSEEDMEAMETFGGNYYMPSYHSSRRRRSQQTWQGFTRRDGPGGWL